MATERVDIEAHIRAAFEDVPFGMFLPIAKIASYGNKVMEERGTFKHPTQAAIAARLFPGGKPISRYGVLAMIDAPAEGLAVGRKGAIKMDESGLLKELGDRNEAAAKAGEDMLARMDEKAGRTRPRPPGFVQAEYNNRVQRAKEGLHLARFILHNDNEIFINHLARLFVENNWDLKIYGRDQPPE